MMSLLGSARARARAGEGDSTVERTAIVTDTNSGILPAEAKELGIHVICMPFFVDGATYHEGQDLTEAEFFRKLAAGATVSTSQPPPEEVTALWDRLLETHDAVLYFPMSSGLSGACQTGKALARDYGGRVVVVDDRRISVTLRQSILNARVLLAQGKTAREVRDILEAEWNASSIYIAVNTLEYLRRSGRITAAGQAMATILHLKPVLQIQGGKLDAYKKVRGMKHARDVLIEALRHDLAERFAGMKMALFSGTSGGDPALGEAWHELVQAAFPGQTIGRISLPLSICCHVGEGALGVACAKTWE